MENVVKSPIDNPPPLLPAFAVSVVIPMYNVDKYVGECLDSLLAQTFQDFDVIVVDDCSTDNSREIVKSYESKFSGRLTIAQTEKNSGGAGEPRNIGIELSTGEYISFIDPDDTIMPNTLKEMYNAAKKFEADVVHCEKWYGILDEFYNDAEYRKNMTPTVHPSGERIFTTQPTLLTNDIEKRVKDFCQKRWLTWSVCLQMIRRDFMFENEIRFTNVYAEDMIFTMCEICCAKNYLVMPNTFYLYRLRKDSSIKGHVNLSVKEIIHKYVLTLKNGINYLDKFLSTREFFSHRPNLKYVLFNAFMNEIIYLLKKAYDEFSPYDIDELLRKELDDNSAFTAFLFNNTYRLKSAVNQKRISVIIPMYNAEKYIGDCLDSLLDQTFQDFEVIVVDDCSTDNSIQVVNGYGTRFNGRLKLIKTDENTGSPGEPGNLGVSLSRGEYLFIMDNDDAVTPDALEKLYTTAKKYDADVVACDKYYWVPEKSWNDAEFRKNLKPHGYQQGGPVSEPTLLPFNIPQRVQDCYGRKFLWELWTKLIRRDFLIENEIRFTKNIIQDFVATCCMAYTAKKFVRVPYAVNFYRVRESSLYHQKRKPLQQLEMYLSSLKFGFKYLDEFLSKRDFFQKNLETKRIALCTYLKEIWELYIRKIYHEVPTPERNKVLRKIFTDDDQTILTEFFFYALEDFSKINAEAQIMHKLSRFFTGRVDFKFWSTEGDFQLLSVSDDRAEVLKPDWFQKGGIGYVIMSHTGKVEFVVKATANGRVNFDFRGMWVQDPEDKTKLIPYWIDYTKLIVNGQIIFDKITPAWHDQPYFYTMEAKANEEIKVQFEWLPHRGDILPEVSKTEEKPPVDKFPPYVTSRMDVKLESTKGDFQILSMSDDNASVQKPTWLQKNGIGYTIQSYAGKMEFVAKTTADGKIDLALRGLDVPDPKDNSKRIPYWIDYTKLTVNGKLIIDKITPAWHDKAYRHNIDAKANEEIKIQVEWLPHRDDILPEVSKTEEKPPVDKFPPYVTSRMDVKLESTKGDFQILSMSDDNASVQKPTWLQKNGIGYTIQSYAGKMEFVAKTTADGKIDLALRGLDVPDPKDNSKRIPYWIDYTKLTVNGKLIIDKITPAWHDKAYRHNIDAKANEEIKIQVEWLPHRDDILPEVSKTEEKPPVDKFPPYVTSRMDVKLESTKGDFQILSMSDDNASVQKPTWLQKNGIGYTIQSYAGKMEFVAKATADGKINVNLMGMDVRDPKDNSKRVPNWIDYTKLTINGKTIIDKITPAWHDKPYNHSMDAKAGEEIKFQVEWLPHRDDILPEVSKPEEKSLVDKFLPYVTGRLDVKLQSTDGDFQILSVSDDNAEVLKPAWLQRGGIGYTIQSYAGKMEFVAKATADGKINLDLRGLDVPDPKDNSKRIPYWIDYTKLTINGKSIIDKRTPAWHDKAYYYGMDAKANEEIKIQVEWLPHIADIDKDFSTEHELDQKELTPIPITENLTAISVIIPMYNAEKYIAECLDSLLAQTFKDFEVIVVDDCSTDNSVKIVESYTSKFDGHLKLYSTDKNFGSGALARNKGLIHASGEYVYNMDNDDTLTKTALEELYTLAKKYDADVVYCEKYFMSTGYGEEFIKNIYLANKEMQPPPFVDKPTLETEDLSERVEKILNRRFWVVPWDKLVKRNLLLKNKIFFPGLTIGDDDIWSYGLIFFAKKFLRVPNIIYIRRMRDDSITGIKKSPKQAMNFHLNPFLLGLKSLDNLMAKHEFFKTNPQKRYAILKRFFNDTITAGFNDAAQLSVDEVYETIKSEFSERLGDFDVPISALCSALFKEKNSSAISKFRNYITGRVDFKFWSTEGDFQLLSVSDDSAEVLKPDWFQKGGVGYVIMSQAGKVEFVAKATANGQVRFELRGMWVQDPENKSKLIPYWIDYTKLAVNGKTIFDKITPAWHDQPYVYTMETKANEEIKVKFEWLPHREDILPDKIVEKPTVDKFPPYVTSRMDIKLQSTKGDFQILSMSDNQAEVIKPTWLQKGGIGYQIQSYAGKMEFIAKATADGKINVNLLGMDVRDPKDNSKRVPNWIDYTKLTINGKSIIDKITPAWHDKPYNHSIDAKADEEIKIQVEWLPHRSDT